METIIIRKIWFINKKPISLINDYKDAKEDDCISINKFSKEEWKSYIFGEYNNGKFDYRKKLVVEGDISSKKIGESIKIKISKKCSIGEGTLSSISDGKYIIRNLHIYKDKKPLDDIKDYFVPFENFNISKKDKERFINGLFKINYDFIKYYLDYHFFKVGREYKSKFSNRIIYYTPESKFSALCSYLAIKDMFLLKGYKISTLDCFVSGEKLEYDALVLKKDTPLNKRIYDKDEVLATIEIKTSGYFNDNIKTIEGNFGRYMDSQKIDEIPHIYIALHELIGYYKNTHSKFNNNGLVPMFCKIKETNDYITIPYEYDIDELLNKIKKH